MKKMLLFLLLFSLCQTVFADETKETLNIYVSDMKPLVVVGDLYTPPSISGFEVDLWNAVAKELVIEGAIKDWKFTAVKWSDIEKNIKNGNADVGFSGITIRSYRMNWAEFSLPTMNSGLGIMVLKDGDVNTLFFKLGLLYEALSTPIFLFGLFVLFFAHIIWLTEKGKDGFSNKYFPGIFETF